jgi:hypothetical protein
MGPVSGDNLDKPYFKLGEGGRLFLQNVPVPPQSSRQSPSVPLAKQIRRVLVERTFLYPLFEDVRDRALARILRLIGQSRSAAAYVDPAQNQKALAATLLRRMRDEVERAGSRFVVLLLPGYGFFDGLHDEYEGIRTWFRDELSELEVIEIAPAFESHRGEPLYGPIIEHWTPAGSRLAAEALSDELLQRYRPVVGAGRPAQG